MNLKVLQREMNETKQNTMLELVQLMSSKPSAERPVETLQYLPQKSHNADNANLKIFPNRHSKHYVPQQNVDHAFAGANSESLDDITGETIISHFHQENAYVLHERGTQNAIQTDFSVRTEIDAHAVYKGKDVIMGQGGTNKRKWKYADIYAPSDNTFIEFESGYSNHQEESKNQKYSGSSINGNNAQAEVRKRQGDTYLVRKLIQMLTHPMSRRLQECIVALLRADGDLRRLFVEEKAKMGKQSVPVFRRLGYRDCSQSRSNDVSSGLLSARAHGDQDVHSQMYIGLSLTFVTSRILHI